MRDFTKEMRAAMLTACSNVYSDYPNDFTKTPCVSFFENLNNSADGTDLLTNIGFQVDVWAKTIAELKSMVAAVDIAVRGTIGLRRSFSQQITDPSSGYRHQSMRFEGTYNALDQKIYSRS